MLLGLVLSVCAALAQVFGGYLVLSSSHWPRNWERTLLALGAGFLLALVFVDLIPESIHLTNNSRYSVLVMLAGFSALHFFEHTVVEHMHFGEETHHDAGISHSSVFGAVGGLTLHAFFDGMSISAAASARSELGILVFVAVLLHKVPEGLTVASVMVSGKRTFKEARSASLLLALATCVGALVVVLFVTIDETLIGFLFAFSAGSSVYVGACDLIPEINRTRGRKAPLLVFFGMVIFFFGELIVKTILGV
ncbi:MAG: ZIP family metal transporter [Candidatus Kapaibacterium sp.]